MRKVLTIAIFSLFACMFICRESYSIEEDTIKEALGGPEKIERIEGEDYIFYSGKNREDDFTGFAVILNGEGKHGFISFLVAIEPEGKIQKVEVLETSEVKGKAINQKRFLRQFVGKDSESPIELGKDIHAVTGATVSSAAAARAIKRALVIWEERRDVYGKKLQ